MNKFLKVPMFFDSALGIAVPPKTPTLSLSPYRPRGDNPEVRKIEINPLSSPNPKEHEWRRRLRKLQEQYAEEDNHEKENQIGKYVDNVGISEE